MEDYNWREFLRLAQSLASDTTDEASLRSAISRAYYAAHGTARQFLRNEGLTDRQIGQHRQMWKRFENHDDMVRRQVGVTANRLRTRRNQADYDEALQKPDVLARSSIQDSTGILQALKDFGDRTT